MTAQTIGPDEGQGHEVIHLGGAAAVVVPIEEYRVLRAVARRATPQVLADAEAEAASEDYEAWVAAGRRGVVSHEEAMAFLLGGETARS